MELTHADRCGIPNCGAQAHLGVVVYGADLYFCAHHSRDREVRLFELATDWVDNRASILEVPRETADA